MVVGRIFREVGDRRPSPNVFGVDEQLRTDLERINDRLKTLQVRL